MTALTSSIPTALCVMNTTMERAALFSAVPGMMPLATSLAESVVRRSATQAGRASTARNQFACLDVMNNMAFVTSLENANVGLGGKGVIVTSASDTQAVFMVPVNNLGNATVRKAGVAFSVTKILIIVLIISLAKMVPLAPILAREATLVLAVLGTRDPTVRLKSMNVMLTPARMVEAAPILKTAIPVTAHLASMVKTVS